MRKNTTQRLHFPKPAARPMPPPQLIKTAEDLMAAVEKSWPETIAINAVRAKHARAEMDAYMAAGFSEDQALQLVRARIKPI